MQDFLVSKQASPEILAFPPLHLHEKLAGVSIHEIIKAKRTSLGLSMQALAEAVSKIENLSKPIRWQTVQQWENGQAAPKRTRLAAVAAALKTTPHELMGGTSAESVTGVRETPLPYTVEKTTDSDAGSIESIKWLSRELARHPPSRRKSLGDMLRRLADDPTDPGIAADLALLLGVTALEKQQTGTDG